MNRRAGGNVGASASVAGLTSHCHGRLEWTHKTRAPLLKDDNSCDHTIAPTERRTMGGAHSSWHRVLLSKSVAFRHQEALTGRASWGCRWYGPNAQSFAVAEVSHQSQADNPQQQARPFGPESRSLVDRPSWLEGATWIGSKQISSWKLAARWCRYEIT